MSAKKLKNYTLFWSVSLLTMVLDQLTKYLIQAAQRVQADTLYVRLCDWANLVYVKNTGAAWGVMSGSGTILGLLAVVALASIYYLRSALHLKRWPMQIAFGLLTAGIAGNMIDRLFLGYVVDFMDLTIFGFRFPSFNVADVGITTGVVMYVIYSTFENPVNHARKLVEASEAKAREARAAAAQKDGSAQV